MASSSPEVRPMQVLCLGLPRSGSLSLREALKVIGYNVHHTIPTLGTPRLEVEWRLLDKICDKLFPELPTYAEGEVTRADWDEVYGPYDGVSDTGACFAPWLVDAYPEAKVIIVKRDYEKWKTSCEGLIDIVLQTASTLAIKAEKFTGSCVTGASVKMMQCCFHGLDKKEMKRNLRRTYDNHHRMIHEKVAPERLLVYELGSGWEPLCEFLGKPVPQERFPWVNEFTGMRDKLGALFWKQFLDGVVVAVPWMVGAAALGFASWRVVRRRL